MRPYRQTSATQSMNTPTLNTDLRMRREIVMLIIILATLTVAISESSREHVFLHDLNHDHARRHLSAGLPSYLEFDVRRENGAIRLELRENLNLNPNPPLFEFQTNTDGQRILVRKETVPVRVERFYHEYSHGGSFSVRCEFSVDGPCRRLLTGSFFLNGENFDIYPAPETETKRGLAHDKYGEPHVLIRREIPEKFRGLNYLHTIGLVNHLFGQSRGYLEKKPHLRPNHEVNNYTVEVFVVLDRFLISRYAQNAPENQSPSQEDHLRRLACLIINEVDLSFRLIDDPEMSIKIVLSGVWNPEQLAEYPIPKQYLTGSDVTYYTDGVAYLKEMTDWMKPRTDDFRDFDHLMVLTGADIYKLSDDKRQHDYKLRGISWIGGICSTEKVSLVEAYGSFFTTSSAAAHQLAHSLGFPDDEYEASENCSSDSYFIMSSEDSSNYESDTISVIPLRFSRCSKDAMKSHINTLVENCLVNEGTVKVQQEFTDFTSKLPGEIYNKDGQCKLLQGQNSSSCENSVDACRLKCMTASGECNTNYRAAMGTQCGTNKWCIFDACVSKDYD